MWWAAVGAVLRPLPCVCACAAAAVAAASQLRNGVVRVAAVIAVVALAVGAVGSVAHWSAAASLRPHHAAMEITPYWYVAAAAFPRFHPYLMACALWLPLALTLPLGLRMAR